MRNTCPLPTFADGDVEEADGGGGIRRKTCPLLGAGTKPAGAVLATGGSVFLCTVPVLIVGLLTMVGCPGSGSLWTAKPVLVVGGAVFFCMPVLVVGGKVFLVTVPVRNVGRLTMAGCPGSGSLWTANPVLVVGGKVFFCSVPLLVVGNSAFSLTPAAATVGRTGNTCCTMAGSPELAMGEIVAMADVAVVAAADVAVVAARAVTALVMVL